MMPSERTAAGHGTESDSVKMSFQPGDRVYWWKRITLEVQHPHRAQVVTVGTKRITIAVEDLQGGSDRIIRHVTAESLQPVAVWYGKAQGQGPAMLEPVAAWGTFTSYLEIGEDLRPVRQVYVFGNGNMLSYDRAHWIDEFGMLGGARINRNRKQGPWGQSEEIDAGEFERVWVAARTSPLWQQQVATAQMARRGDVPIWLKAKEYR